MSRNDRQLWVAITFFQAWYGLLFNLWFLAGFLVASVIALVIDNAYGDEPAKAFWVAVVGGGAFVSFVIRFVRAWRSANQETPAEPVAKQQ